MSTFNNETFLAAQKTSVDTLLAAANTALAAAERVAALNLHTMLEVFEDLASSSKAVLAVRTPEDALALPSCFAQLHVSKGVAYTRSVYEMSSAARDDATAIVENRFEDFKKNVALLSEKISLAAPAGSEVALATLKATTETANEVFARFNESMNQVRALAESNVAFVSNAAMNAVPKPDDRVSENPCFKS